MTRIHVIPADSSWEVSGVANKIAKVLGGQVARPYSGEWFLPDFQGISASQLGGEVVVDGTVDSPLPGLSLLPKQAAFAADDGGLVILVVPSEPVARAAWATLREGYATVGALLQIGGEPFDGAIYSDSLDISDEVAGQLAEIAELPAPTAITPNRFRANLVGMAAKKRRRIVLPESNDDRVLKAAEILAHLNVADIVLLGDEKVVRADAEKLRVDISEIYVESPTLHADKYANILFEARKHKGMTLEKAKEMVLDVSYYGTLMVAAGDADGMVSGAVHTTADTIRPALQIIKPKPGTKAVSGAFLLCMGDHVDVYADCAVNIDPSALELADITRESVATARAFNIDPRVALLSYSTGDSGVGPTVEKIKETKKILTEQGVDFKFDGPLQFDAAVDRVVAAQKMPGSPVAGKANVFVFTDLNQGNCTYKAVQRSAGAVAVGPILQGLNKPVNDLSRGCLVEDIVNTVLITAIQAQS